MNNIIRFILFFGLFISSCHKDCAVYPHCISELIQTPNKDISAVYSYTYFGETVYHFNPQGDCCDLANTIYSSNCTVICVLNGLIGNQICKGDTFYIKATDKALVWKK